MRVTDASSLPPARIAAFWRLVERTETHWYWRGRVTATGGMPVPLGASRGPARRTVVAPRLAWELTRGPLKDFRVLRRVCDEPLCICPAHHRRLWERYPLPVTPLPPEPARPPRVLPPLSALPPCTVAQIHHLRAFGATPARLAVRFNLSPGQIARILAGEPLVPRTVTV